MIVIRSFTTKEICGFKLSKSDIIENYELPSCKVKGTALLRRNITFVRQMIIPIRWSEDRFEWQRI